MAEVTLAMSQLKLGKGEIERGAGDSASLRPCQGAGATEGPNKKKKNKKGTKGSNVNTNEEIIELFRQSLTKKRNMFSTNPDPLTSPWTFWSTKTTRGLTAKEYEESLVCIHTAYTVPRFWDVCNTFPLPKNMGIGTTVHMMRAGRKPMWEEAVNCLGGTFRMCFHKRYTKKLWTEFLVAAAGEQLNDFLGKNDEVCGVSLSIRETDDMIVVWNTKADVAHEAKILEFIDLLRFGVKIESKYYIANVTHVEVDRSRAPVEMENRTK